MHSPIYLDNNATTPVLPEVADAVCEASLRYQANPDSQHEPGRQARRALEDARERIGELLGARVGAMASDTVVFTSGGTEANNLALLGLAAACRQPGHIILPSIEHPCVTEACVQLKRRGWAVDYAQPSPAGDVPVQQFERLARPETRLATLMLANNETGVVQPVGEVVRLFSDREVLVHTDAAQAIGKIPVDFRALGVHSMSLSAHKFHAPMGIGALVLRHGLKLQPLLFGGHQQDGLRPGTQTVALAIGMCVALETQLRQLDEQAERIAAARDEFEHRMTAAIPESLVIGTEANRLPNTSNIAFVGLDRQALAMALDMAGVACSTGSACASGSSEPSPILQAMKLEKPIIDGSIRFSLSCQTTATEAADAAGRIIKVCKQLGLATKP